MEDKKLFCGDFATTALGRKIRCAVAIEELDQDADLDSESQMHSQMTSEPVPATVAAIPF
jgi:hypothetical protein